MYQRVRGRGLSALEGQEEGFEGTGGPGEGARVHRRARGRGLSAQESQEEGLECTRGPGGGAGDMGGGGRVGRKRRNDGHL